MSNDNTNATNTNKRKRDEDDVEETPISTLKKSRYEAKSSNSSRVKWRPKSTLNPEKLSKSQIKMEKRLEPILQTLESLPTALASEFKEFASSILSRKIELLHCEKRTKFHETTPTFMPSSVRGYMKFELTCKTEFQDNVEFTDLKKKANLIVEEAKLALRDTIVSVQRMEEKGTKELLIKEFVQGLLDIFELCSLYTRTSVKEVEPPFDDKDASELLLQRFFFNFC